MSSKTLSEEANEIDQEYQMEAKQDGATSDSEYKRREKVDNAQETLSRSGLPDSQEGKFLCVFTISRFLYFRVKALACQKTQRSRY